MTELHHGDNLDILPTLPDASVDAIVTDPPYELTANKKGGTGQASGGFMGKHWDATGISFNVELWRECLRVLKPGGHLLAFGGSRTYHRLAVAIEDAGFEIRDQIQWIYGSGFPKSLDVGKAIDKQRDDSKESAIVAAFILRHADGRGVSEFREYLNRAIVGESHAGGSAQGWTTTNLNGVVKPRVPTWEQWEQIKDLLSMSDEMDAEVWRLNGRKGKPDVQPLASVPNVGANFLGDAWNATPNRLIMPDRQKDAAKQWDGWGSALKPAHEPIVMARKPLDGTIAGNVLRHGTGAINIDGCRVINAGPHGTEGRKKFDGFNSTEIWGSGGGRKSPPNESGRFPANVILSCDCDEYVLKSTVSESYRQQIREFLSENA